MTQGTKPIFCKKTFKAIPTISRKLLLLITSYHLGLYIQAKKLRDLIN